MPLLLPNLDDRNWLDLVDEGRSLIPVYGPEWTDHNPSNPGIMLTELLALFAEMDIYQLNQISDRERLKFLKLIGVVPRPPAPAWSVLRIQSAPGVSALTLPAGLEFAGLDASSEATRYRTLDAITLAPGTLETVQFSNGNTFQNLTAIWQRRGSMTPFGPDPKPGCEFYLGFSDGLPVATDVHLFLSFGTRSSGYDERRRILEEARAQERDCRPPLNPCLKDSGVCGCHSDAPDRGAANTERNLTHYGVRLEWEFMTAVPGGFQWLRLDPTKQEVKDGTRAFTLDGNVTLHLPSAMTSSPIGSISKPKYNIRCRFVAGSYDAAPALQDVALNGLPVEQSVPYGMAFVIDSAAAIHYSASGPPQPNQVAFIRMTLDGKNRIVGLDFDGNAESDPGFLIYDYREPKYGASGLLAFEGALLGLGSEFPGQQLKVPGAPVDASSFQLFSLESGRWQRWRLRQDFDASTRKDLHAILDASLGTVTFGNGEKGRVPAGIGAPYSASRAQCLIFAKYRTTRAESGNLALRTIRDLADSPHNRALLYDPMAVPDGWSSVKAKLSSITNPLPAAGGSAAETVALASGRADQLVESSDRAITLADYEELALHTPGTQIARVSARANLHPSFPCFKAPGMITVMVLPFLPLGRPMPTQGLRQTVLAYLRRRRIVGTRVEVVPPTYLEVSIQADVKALAGTNKNNLQKTIVAAISKFLDPLVGGPAGDGWPFGRDVYRSEIMRTIDEVPGVDYVASLALLGPDGQPQCGNLCLGPTWLVAPGTHRISVL